jgi:competence ComEA-like helix-hairpin-helix protein
MLRSIAGIAMLVAAAIAGRAQTPGPVPTPPSFPEGEGKTALLRMCGQCHGPENAVSHLKTPDDWKRTIDEMKDYGAQGADEEFAQIRTYLVMNFSLIMVNTATAKELESTLGIAATTADAIVRHRAEKGDFTSVEDLESVSSLDAAKVAARKDRLIF